MQAETLAEVRAWLRKSAHDITAAQRLSAGSEPLWDVVVYHCQQAAEKALKGYLTGHDRPFAKTHALMKLVAAAAELDDSFLELEPAAEFLSPFAWRFRYPGDLMDPERAEAEEALRMAVEVMAFVMARLPSEAAAP